MFILNPKSNVGCEAGCGLTVSFSDHGRIILGMVSDRPPIPSDISPVFGHLFEILQSHFAWQVQYLVRVEGDTCCSAHCK